MLEIGYSELSVHHNDDFYVDDDDAADDAILNWSSEAKDVGCDS